MPFTTYQRCLEPEQMDQPNLEAERHVHALRGLARINWWSGSAGILWPAIRDLARKLNRPIRLLDLAAGAGDVPLRLSQKAARAGIALEIQGCDRSEQALEHARRRARNLGIDAIFFACDVTKDDLPAEFDVLTSSLFLHHLESEQAVGLLRAMSRATRALVLVNDLRRCRLGYATAWLGTRILSRSPIVHFDGPQSVAAAFTLEEARNLASQAGLTGALVSRRWPFRWLLKWDKLSLASNA